MAERITSRILLGIVSVLAVMAARLDGQSQQQAAATTPTFDVASIKPLAPPYPSGGGAWIVSHGRFKAPLGFVRALAGWSNRVLAAQVKGGPDWIDRELYDIDARSDNTDAGPDQIRLMLQALLADRFKLVVHRETQQAQVYALVVGKNGPKLQEVPDGKKNYINWTGPGQATFTENTTLLGLINVLSTLLGSPVVDETALNGTYSFSLEFTDPRDPHPTDADSRPDIFSAVQDQLGLKLEAKKAPVEVLVIDHVERPSAN